MENERLFKNRPVLPLVVFRIAFGAVLFLSTVRFIRRGWVTDFYITPLLHFPFFGMEWLKPLPGAGMYVLYGAMVVFAFGICTGLFYRVCAVGFLVAFTYTGLLDKTYYLNHYYLISLMCFLLAWAPANAAVSLDVWRGTVRCRATVPAWTIGIFRLQLAVIYICAGLSKLTHDWLIDAMPLRIWLRARGNLPVIGEWLAAPPTAWIFSWASALFDLGIVFLLWRRKTLKAAYLLVLLFHGLTACLFQIGMFPWLMITATLIFFPASAWTRLWQKFKGLIPRAPDLCPAQPDDDPAAFTRYYPMRIRRRTAVFIGIYFAFQILVPFRFLLYPGKLLWTEEGYRFSWRVMLMEKSGTTFFYLTDSATGVRKEIGNREFLTAYQERMMETQPDMIAQYAKKLKVIFQNRGVTRPKITVESYISLNGRRSRLLIDSSVDLATAPVSCFGHQNWILPFTGKTAGK